MVEVMAPFVVIEKPSMPSFVTSMLPCSVVIFAIQIKGDYASIRFAHDNDASTARDIQAEIRRTVMFTP